MTIKITQSNVESALYRLPFDAPRIEWLKCASAVKDALGESGLPLFLTYSSIDPRYNEHDATAVYRSADPNKCGVGYLFKAALDTGWRPDESPDPQYIPLPTKRRDTTQADQDAAHKAAKAAAKAAALLATPCPADNPYLVRKGLMPCPGLCELTLAQVKSVIGYNPKTKESAPLDGRILIVPAYVAGALSSVQLIDSDGRKHFLFGGKLTGASFIIGSIRHGCKIAIVEGLSTGLSIHAATQWPVVVAFSSGQLVNVAKAIQAAWPVNEIGICGDDDRLNRHNAGRTSAIKAGRETGAEVYFPPFTQAEIDAGNTDWNDYSRLHGISIKDFVPLESDAPPVKSERKPSTSLPFRHSDPLRASISLALARENLPAEILDAHNTGGFFLHCGSPGIGKTQALCGLPVPIPNWLGEYEEGVQIVIAVPTIELGQQAANTLNAFHGRDVAQVVVGRDRDHPATGVPMCHRREAVQAMTRAGLAHAVRGTLCINSIMGSSGKQSLLCPHYFACLYNRQKKSLSHFAFQIIPHESLFNEFVTFQKKPRTLIIDELPLGTAVHKGFRCKSAHSIGYANVMAAIPEGFDFAPFSRVQLALQAGESITEDTCTAIHALLKQYQTSAPEGIGPTTPDQEILEAIENLPAPAFAGGWRGAARAILRHAGGETTSEVYLDAASRLAATWRRPIRAKAESVIALDGTGVAAVWEAILGHAPTVIGAPVRAEDYNISLFQDIRATWHKSGWHRSEKCEGEVTEWVTDTAKGSLLHCRNLLGGGDVALIGQKSLVDLFPEWSWPKANFNGLRGLNGIDSSESLLLVGRVEPPAVDIEAIARALWPCEALTLTAAYADYQDTLRTVDGAGAAISIHDHPDARCSAVLRQIRDAESWQALARLRPFGDGPRRAVLVLSTVPMPIPATVVDASIPHPVARVFGKTGQADVLPLSKHTLEAMGLGRDERREVQGWAKNYWGGSLSRISPKTTPPIISGDPPLDRRGIGEYRKSGARGASSPCLILSSPGKALPILEVIHSTSVEWVKLPKAMRPPAIAGGECGSIEGGAFDTAAAVADQVAVKLTAAEADAIRAAVFALGDDESVAGEVVAQCQTDPAFRKAWLERAAALADQGAVKLTAAEADAIRAAVFALGDDATVAGEVVAQCQTDPAFRKAWPAIPCAACEYVAQ